MQRVLKSRLTASSLNSFKHFNLRKETSMFPTSTHLLQSVIIIVLFLLILVFEYRFRKLQMKWDIRPCELSDAEIEMLVPWKPGAKQLTFCPIELARAAIAADRLRCNRTNEILHVQRHGNTVSVDVLPVKFVENQLLTLATKHNTRLVRQLSNALLHERNEKILDANIAEFELRRQTSTHPSDSLLAA